MSPPSATSSARSTASPSRRLKRKTIGRLFIETFEREAKKIAADGRGPVEFLAQGTLYPDVIESVSFSGGPSVTIKSHHNVGGLPERMNMKLVEPLRELFKDEVRALGARARPAGKLRRPPSVPRPRPRDPHPRRASARRSSTSCARPTRSTSRKSAPPASTTQIWQAFAVLLPVRTVGVMGDGRTYDSVCALRAVTSSDGMTADFFPFDMGFLGRAATRIINEVKGVNRVVYDVTSASRRGRSSGSRGGAVFWRGGVKLRSWETGFRCLAGRAAAGLV